MKHLSSRLATPKGDALGLVQRMIVAWLREHGPATPGQVRDGLIARGTMSFLMLDADMRFWAEDYLYELYHAGHLCRDRQDGGAAVYRVAQTQTTAAPDAPALARKERTQRGRITPSPLVGEGRGEGDPAPEVAANVEPPPGLSFPRRREPKAAKAHTGGSATGAAVERGSVALPRHIDVMNGPVLSGGQDAPVREGAMDYAAIPSLIGGQRVPHRAGRTAT